MAEETAAVTLVRAGRAVVEAAERSVSVRLRDGVVVAIGAYDADAEGAWLDPDGAADDRLDLFVPAPDDALVAREVSDRVNDVRKDGPALIEPREEQGALF